jgi:hypothetical protein
MRNNYNPFKDPGFLIALIIAVFPMLIVALGGGTLSKLL